MPTCPVCHAKFLQPQNSRPKTYCGRACANSLKRADKTPSNSELWFWNRTKTAPSGCLEWQGCLKNGYGLVYKFSDPCGEVYAHRISFIMHHGRKPIGVVRHTCDNRKCVNPRHLLEGSAQDNVRDAVERDRVAYGEKSAASKLTQAQVDAIRCATGRHTDLARSYGVSDSTICRIRRGKAWRRSL